MLAMATTEAFAVPERTASEDDSGLPTHSAISPSGSSTHCPGAYLGWSMPPETKEAVVNVSKANPDEVREYMTRKKLVLFFGC